MFIDERERKRERDRQTDTDWVPPVHAPTGYQTHNLALCADQKSNSQSFGVWDDAPTN